MYSEPRMLQGVFPFEGQGLERPFLLNPVLTYVVPRQRQAQLVYFRAGNSSEEMIDLLFVRDGLPMRHFPIGARGDCHITLAIVEDLLAGTQLEIHIGAPEGVRGTVVLDVGLMELDGTAGF